MNGLQVKHILCAFLQFEAKLKTQLFANVAVGSMDIIIKM